ncbi:MAG TPA: PqqD family peptide modification chaperone [Drouetiella sp.]|jgi:GT2 family glycosyltransferase
MLDVVIVAKNEQRHLGAVLSAIRNQRNYAEQIKTFVVDNGSSDDTVAIARSHGAQVVQCAGNLGKARNTGIKCGENALVAFLDAHSVPTTYWAESLTAAFSNREDLGAVMGSVENISERPGTDMFAKHSIFSSPEKLRLNTICGLNSPLPWIPTGNCAYTRKALEEVGGFNEQLFRCEDTDLSWKVVLKGYQLDYAANARVTHYDQAGATSFLRKYYNYGAGAAELAHVYGMKARPQTKKLRGAKFLLDVCYRLGLASKSLQPRKRPLHKFSVDQKFRMTFRWSDIFNLSLSQEMVFWSADGDSVICVNFANDTRLLLEDTSALIFEMLTKHADRAQTIKEISKRYDVAQSTITADVDDLVQELIDNEILVRYDAADTSPIPAESSR